MTSKDHKGFPAGRPEVEGFHDAATGTVSYVVHSGPGTACAIIDPVTDFDPGWGQIGTRSAERVIDFVRANRLAVEWVLETHLHHDHLTAASVLRDMLGGQLGTGTAFCGVAAVVEEVFDLPRGAGKTVFDVFFDDGSTFDIGDLGAEVLCTPGHTRDSVSYRIGDAVFVGDVLLMPDAGTGRCDFHGGDAGTLYASIRRLLALPPETRVFVCHDYAPGGRAPTWEATVAQHRDHNVHLCGSRAREDDFVARRTERDRALGAPALLLPALQVNAAGGRLPSPAANGRAYLRLPVNVTRGVL